MSVRYWWEDENDRPVRAIDSRSHEGIAYMNWCVRQKPADPQPNAVERLLAQAEEVVALFDAMFGQLACHANPLEAECLSTWVAKYAFADFFAPNEREDGPPRYREVLTDDRLGLMKRWESDGAVHLAVERTIAENTSEGRHHGRGHDLSPDEIAAYCDILAARESLLDADQWISLVQNVIQDSAAWGLHEGRIGELASAVRASVQPLWGLAPKPAARRMSRSECRDGWESLKAPLRAAIAELRLYAKPPRPINTSHETKPALGEPQAEGLNDASAAEAVSTVRDDSHSNGSDLEVRPKRHSPKGSARPKLIAALNKHHRYEHPDGINHEPIGNNDLARLARVDPSTASAFFAKEFGGYESYRRTCRDSSRLAIGLRAINGEIKPHDLFGRAPPGEGARRDDE